MFASIIASIMALTTVQTAAELEEACLAYQAEFGGEADCTCLAEAVAADEDLIAEIAEITTPEDLENASEEFLAAVADCS